MRTVGQQHVCGGVAASSKNTEHPRQSAGCHSAGADRGRLSLRIAHLVSTYHPLIGGVETHVRHLAEGCSDAGDQVTVLTHQLSRLCADEWIGAVRVRRFPLTAGSANYPFSLSLWRFLRSHAADFDLVHVHSYHTIVGHAARGSGLPVVFTPHYHGTGHTPLRAVLHRLYRPVGAHQFWSADAIICVSEAERGLVLKDFPGVARRTVTIPNGTEPKLPSSPESWLKVDAPLVLTVGRLERYKNVDLIIAAFRALPSAAILAIVGDGPDRPRLERRAKASEPGWPVLFTGKIPDWMLDQLFAQASVVASASDHEAFGLTLADGLASGVRVVASDIPAHAALACLAGNDAPVALVDPRETARFTEVLAASLRAGRIPPGELKLPTWAEVVTDIRELYAQVCWRGGPADRRCPA
jgi:glycosyltransferase involved in cell wall biosynthesis